MNLNESVLMVIEKNPETQKFFEAIKAAEMETVLEGPGPFTIFAPSNEAFDKLGKEKFDDLLKPENRMELRKILLYHISPGILLSSDLTTTTLPTAIGKDLNIQVHDSDITVNGAQVLEPDNEGENGVVHVINKVLIP